MKMRPLLPHRRRNRFAFCCFAPFAGTRWGRSSTAALMGATGGTSTSWRSWSVESRLLRKSLAVRFVTSCQDLVQQGQPPTAVQLHGHEQGPMRLLSCMCLAKQGAGLLQHVEPPSQEQAPAHAHRNCTCTAATRVTCNACDLHKCV